MLEFTHGDMFEAAADIRVNTVNCVGVMGAGVALAFKQRYPEMFKDYQRDCKDGLVKPGKVHVWKSLAGDCIVNFPTKRDWREPSRYEDIVTGLDDLRAYLDSVGTATVALPALGCGHGGLDWARVSSLIREKLDGVNAHVLIFEPASSRKAGHSAIETPTIQEGEDAAKLGYEFLERGRVLPLGVSTPLYVLGDQEPLSRKWIALLPSRAPAEREIEALRAIASELSRSGNGVTIGLVYGVRGSEDVARLFTSQGISVVLLLPFGVLTRKPIAKRFMTEGSGSLTLASVAPLAAKWSPQIFAQSMELLRTNASAMLLSDPEPEWLVPKGFVKWAHTSISYVRYETTPPYMREILAGIGAKPIGRRSESGTPNIDHLYRGWERQIASNHKISNLERTPESIGWARESATFPTLLDDGNGITIRLGDLSEAAKRELFEGLLRLNAMALDVTVRFPKSVSQAEVIDLMRLGHHKENDT